MEFPAPQDIYGLAEIELLWTYLTFSCIISILFVEFRIHIIKIAHRRNI